MRRTGATPSGARAARRWWDPFAPALMVMAGLLAVGGVLLVAMPDVIRTPLGTDRPALAVAVVGVWILVLDALIPVPSSAVMISLGITLGVPLATLASVLGLVGAAVAGYAIGRRVPQRLRTGGDRVARLAPMLAGWRGLGIVMVSRPVPLVAETVATTAGLVRLPLGRFTAACAVGAVSPALVYALVGAGLVGDGSEFPLVVVVTVGVVAASLAAVRWMRA